MQLKNSVITIVTTLLLTTISALASPLLPLIKVGDNFSGILTYNPSTPITLEFDSPTGNIYEYAGPNIGIP